MIRLVGLCVVALGLGACGFSPVYAPPSSAGRLADGPIQIFEIEGRTGHFLRQELVRTVGQGVPGVPPSATLEIALRESVVRLGFAPDQAASRSDYIGTAVWTLRKSDGSLIANGDAKEAASFNFADAAYADIAAQTAAKERVAAMLARSIRDQIFLVAAKDPEPTTPGAAPPRPVNPPPAQPTPLPSRPATPGQ